MAIETFVYHHFTSLDSTNTMAKQIAEAAAKQHRPVGTEVSVIYATVQKAGYGKGGRPWSSSPGNLAASYILHGQPKKAHLTPLTFVCALAVGATLEKFGLDAIEYKWPNDVLVKGKKIAGVLLEASLGTYARQAKDAKAAVTYVVMGFGVNLVSHPVEEETVFPATSFNAHASSSPEVKSFLMALSSQLKRLYNTLENEGFAPIQELWLQKAWHLGGPISALTPKGEKVRGHFEGITDDGALLLDLDGARQTIYSADLMS